MIARKSWRNYLLLAQLAVVLLVLGKLIISPTKENRPITPFIFPQTIPLEPWQQLSSKPLNDKLIPKSGYFAGENIGGHSYSYTWQNRSLEAKMRYLVNTNGDLKYYIKDYVGQLAPFLHEKEGVGVYSMYPYQDKVYLTACINPQGKTSINSDRFRHDGLRHTISLRRILIWLTTQHEIIDDRCLWAYLSIPLDNSPPEDIYPLLESAWFDWHQWWTQHYPRS